LRELHDRFREYYRIAINICNCIMDSVNEVA
jgi:hypothetical protein